MRAFDLTVSGSLVLEGGGTSLSGSSTSTGSFGRIEANNLLSIAVSLLISLIPFV